MNLAFLPIGFSIYVQLPKLRAFPSVRLWVYYPLINQVPHRRDIGLCQSFFPEGNLPIPHRIYTRHL